jgi:hypothetical protein
LLEVIVRFAALRPPRAGRRLRRGAGGAGSAPTTVAPLSGAAPRKRTPVGRLPGRTTGGNWLFCIYRVEHFELAYRALSETLLHMASTAIAVSRT